MDLIGANTRALPVAVGKRQIHTFSCGEKSNAIPVDSSPQLLALDPAAGGRSCGGAGAGALVLVLVPARGAPCGCSSSPERSAPPPAWTTPPSACTCETQKLQCLI